MIQLTNNWSQLALVLDQASCQRRECFQSGLFARTVVAIRFALALFL